MLPLHVAPMFRWQRYAIVWNQLWNIGNFTWHYIWAIELHNTCIRWTGCFRVLRLCVLTWHQYLLKSPDPRLFHLFIQHRSSPKLIGVVDRVIHTCINSSNWSHNLSYSIKTYIYKPVLKKNRVFCDIFSDKGLWKELKCWI